MCSISVIVPVYNVEQYLEKCIKSILNQTFKDFELILVNDGSTDRCGTICDKYANMDGRIRVIHKENGGLSSARNAALNLMTGKYLTFIDSDDYVDRYMLEKNYEIITKYNADIVMNGYINEDADGTCVKVGSSKQQIEVMDAEEAIKTVLIMKKAGVMACAKLYKRQLFSEIRFPVGRTSEDAFIIIDVLSKASKIIYDSSAYYYYVFRENSITNLKYRMNFDEIEAFRQNCVKLEKLFPQIKKYARFRYFVAINAVLRKMMDAHIDFEDKNFQRLRMEIGRHIFEVLTLPVMGIKRKLMMAVLVFLPKVYYLIETNRK